MEEYRTENKTDGNVTEVVTEEINTKETIAAIATGITDSGIGIIRISGKRAVETGNRIFCSVSGKKVLEKADSHVMYYGYALKNDSAVWQDSIIDEVMAVVFIAPRSFTGEDVVEIQCHGGVLVMNRILEAVLKNGARLAEPGEFTKRAFLNGRIDLTKAEAVMDLIHSQNEYALSASVNQLRGKLSEKIKALRSEILYEIAFIESALDDPEHISLDGYPERIEKELGKIMKEIEKLIATAENGKWIKEGIKTVIVGKPNVGKSSLLNFLVGEERAIVTEIAGTTRDILTENVKLQNISLQLIDTAGIRNTADTVEKIGVERAKKYAQDADLILYVIDTSVPIDENDRDILSIIQNKKVIVIMNKSDLVQVVEEKEIRVFFEEDIPLIKASAYAGEGLEELEEKIADLFFDGKINMNHEIVITNLRHKEALKEAYDSLKLTKRSVEDGMPEDFYSIDLMNAYSSLGRMIGEEVDDDLVEEIFSKFCMGK